MELNQAVKGYGVSGLAGYGTPLCKTGTPPFTP